MMLFKTKIQFFTYIIYYSKNLILIYLQKGKRIYIYMSTAKLMKELIVDVFGTSNRKYLCIQYNICHAHTNKPEILPFKYHYWKSLGGMYVRLDIKNNFP